MPPRSRDTICLTASPNQRSQYSWTISYSLLSHRGTWAMWQSRGQGGRREEHMSRTEGPDRASRVSVGVRGCVLGWLVCVPRTNHSCLPVPVCVCVPACP